MKKYYNSKYESIGVGNTIENYNGSTTSDSQCKSVFLKPSQCTATDNLDPSSCVKYAGRCYTNNPNSQCSADNQCTISWTGECVNKDSTKSSLYCRHTGAFGKCTCTLDETLIEIVPNIPKRNVNQALIDKIKLWAFGSLSSSVYLESSKYWKFSRKHIYIGLMSRLEYPWYSNQLNTPLCGPVSAIFCLIMVQPDTYVKIITELYDTGSFTTKTNKKINASKKLLNTSTLDYVGSPIDWILSATIRENDNMFFNVDASYNGFTQNIVTGITSPWENKGALYDIFGYNNAVFDWSFGGDISPIQKGANAIKKGGCCMLLISSNLIVPVGFRSSISIPNHWVSLYDDNIIVEANGHIKIKIFSWAKIYSLDIKQSEIQSYFYGAAYGYPVINSVYKLSLDSLGWKN
jgi:hypothetical protein